MRLFECDLDSILMLRAAGARCGAGIEDVTGMKRGKGDKE